MPDPHMPDIRADDFVEIAGDARLWAVAEVDGSRARIQAMTKARVKDRWVNLVELSLVDDPILNERLA